MNSTSAKRATDGGLGVPRAGFTLVELLVVIAIIGVLVALITPAIFFAIQRAETARQVLEIQGIATAMESYRADNGQYPPDLSGTPEEDLIAINRHLARTHRARDVTADAIVGDLDPAEALVLWLRGTSADPRRPLTGANPSPLFEIDQSRLVDADNDGFEEYYPKGDSTQTPYIYYASSTTNEVNAYDQTAAHVALINENGGIQGKKIPAPYSKVINGQPVYAQAGKFQLISAGNDGLYVDAAYNAATDLKTRGFNQNPLPKVQKDNLANFSENGTFADALDD